MKNLAIVGVVLLVGVVGAIPAQGQHSAKLADLLPRCVRDGSKLRDCHIPDRRTYLELTVNRPDWRTQPNAWQEFREYDRIERLEQGQ